MDWGEKQQKGFTLIELMVALAIAIIVMTLSTPLSNFYKQNRTTAKVHEFVTDLNFARGAAVSHGSCVSMCISNGNSANAQCTTVAGATETWENGWLIFTDLNCNATLDNNETILKQHNAFGNGYTLQITSTDDDNSETSLTNRETITYQASGTAASSNGTWTVCDPTGSDAFTRGIVLNRSGHVQIVDTSDQNAVFTTCPANVPPATEQS